MVILIPAYEPDQRLIKLIEDLLDDEHHARIVIVDDGSGTEFDSIFDEAALRGCDVIRLPANVGKGAALKNGFAHIGTHYSSSDVVCADCDGQHNPQDIAKVAATVEQHGEPTLGVRMFSGDVPFRSRFGNSLTRVVFRVATGIDLADTQTGLRGYPARLLPWLQEVRGQRFEYELEALLAGQRAGHRIIQVPIETIYIDDNESSHFRPLVDSARIYWPFLRFTVSSLAAFVIDFVVFLVLASMTSLGAAVVGARLVSASANFFLNRRLVFDSKETGWASMRKYAFLATALLGANYVLLKFLTAGLGMGLVVAKLGTEATLAIASYRFQQRHVFTDEADSDPQSDGQEPLMVRNSQ